MGLTDTPALTLSDMLSTRQISATELMRATLDRIDAVNDRVNAIVSLRDPDALMTEARAADAQESKGWLHGIPLAIKDLANAAGLPTSMGSPIFAGQIAPKDDIVVARLRAAGAIVIGKTNTPEFGLGSHTFNPVFGATCNPYDTTRSAGGSSGGAAVALATGLLSIADGSDMMGSLRNPAAWSNVYGMRPTESLVPSEPRGDTYLMRLATNGPMARNPRDLAALLDTMAGPDPRQPFSVSLPASLPQIEADISGRRIGWLGDWGGAYPMEAGLLDLCRAALGKMSDIGLQIDDLAPPHPAEQIWDSWVGLRNYAIACGSGPLYDDPKLRAHLKAAMLWEIEAGRVMSGAEVHRLSSLRSAWYARAANLFETYDALVLPSTQVWPFPIDLEYPSEISGYAMDTYHRWMEVVIPASLIGLPVVNLPAGFGSDGLPGGLQLIGPRGSDARLLQIAQSWHTATDWPSARPPELLT